MKRPNKKVILITIITCSLVLFGCKNIRLNNNKDTNNNTIDGTDAVVTESANNQIPDTDFDTVQASNDDEGSLEVKTAIDDTSVIQPVANTELVIYTVNSDAEVVAAVAAIPKSSEITPQLIVETVIDAMAENSLMVGIESVTTENDTVIVSFYSDQPPLANVGAGYETAILDAIAQSLVDNLDNYNKVIYRVEGEAYLSGHVELGINEVYLVD